MRVCMIVKMRLIAGLCLVCAVCLLLSGCSALSFDVRSQLVPPTATGDEQQIQLALERYLAEEYGAAQAEQYKLKYPMEGDYRTAFIVEDVDEDGDDEALVFYTVDSDTEYIHLNYLRKLGTEWESMGDWESESTHVLEVRFGDMNGDGKQELLVGFELSSTRDSQLSLFELTRLSMTLLGSYLYTDFYLGSVSSDDWQDLLLLRVSNTEPSVTARLFSLREQATELGSVALDGYIRSFGAVCFTPVTDTVAGIYLDGYKDNGGMVTELICWDGTTLSAPFYNEDDNMTTLTERDSGVAMADVDADGVMEWPQSEPIEAVPGAPAGGLPRYLTRWCTWDVSAKEVHTELYSVVVPEDGYLFVADETWVGSLAASYDEDTHTLTLGRSSENGTIRTAAVIRAQDDPDGVSDPEGRVFEAVTLQSGQTLWVWFDRSAGLGAELSEILYRITVLS